MEKSIELSWPLPVTSSEQLLLWTLCHMTWCVVCVMWLRCYNLPVDCRESVPPSVSVQGWGLTIYMDSLCHPSAKKFGVSVENSDPLIVECVLGFSEMLGDMWWGSSLMFWESVFEFSLSFPHIRSRTIGALDLVNCPADLIFEKLVFGVHQLGPDAVVGPQVNHHSSLPDDSGDGISDVAHIWDGDVAFLSNLFRFW